MVWSAEMSKNSEQHQENDPQSQSLNKIQTTVKLQILKYPESLCSILLVVHEIWAKTYRPKSKKLEVHCNCNKMMDLNQMEKSEEMILNHTINNNVAGTMW